RPAPLGRLPRRRPAPPRRVAAAARPDDRRRCQPGLAPEDHRSGREAFRPDVTGAEELERPGAVRTDLPGSDQSRTPGPPEFGRALHVPHGPSRPARTAEPCSGTGRRTPPRRPGPPGRSAAPGVLRPGPPLEGDERPPRGGRRAEDPPPTRSE